MLVSSHIILQGGKETIERYALIPFDRSFPRLSLIILRCSHCTKIRVVYRCTNYVQHLTATTRARWEPRLIESRFRNHGQFHATRTFVAQNSPRVLHAWLVTRFYRVISKDDSRFRTLVTESSEKKRSTLVHGSFIRECGTTSIKVANFSFHRRLDEHFRSDFVTRLIFIFFIAHRRRYWKINPDASFWLFSISVTRKIFHFIYRRTASSIVTFLNSNRESPGDFSPRSTFQKHPAHRIRLRSTSNACNTIIENTATPA